MENIEIALGMANVWMKKFSEEGKVSEIDSMILRDTLKEYGADFKKGANTSLCEHTQEASRPGMELVWGAVGGLSFEDLSTYLTVMDRNGYLWQEGAFDDMRTRVNIKGEDKKIGSISPGFAADFWEWLKTSKNE